MYNALNGSSYTSTDDLEFTTIDDVLYISMKNDISFLIDDIMQLYEHQASYNPNMPLRGLMYFSRLYETYITIKKRNIYGRTLIQIPTPNYVIFYNGTEPREAVEEMKLSDAFLNSDTSGRYEWTARMLNLNHPDNAALLNSCKPLYEYTIFISRIQTYQKTMDAETAVEQAVTECIKEGILTEFFTRHRAEVTDLILTEFNEEIFTQGIREEGLEEGLRQGLEQGLKEGEQRFALLTEKLLTDKREKDLLRAVSDKNYREQLYLEYHI